MLYQNSYFTKEFLLPDNCNEHRILIRRTRKILRDSLIRTQQADSSVENVCHCVILPMMIWPWLHRLARMAILSTAQTVGVTPLVERASASYRIIELCYHGNLTELAISTLGARDVKLIATRREEIATIQRIGSILLHGYPLILETWLTARSTTVTQVKLSLTTAKSDIMLVDENKIYDPGGCFIHERHRS